MELIWTIFVGVLLANVVGSVVTFLLVMLPLSLLQYVLKKKLNEQLVKLCVDAKLNHVIIEK